MPQIQPLKTAGAVTSPADAPSSAADLSAAAVWIEISRGRTLYPRRPMLADRFLIGAGSSCHLQLGGQDMPFLHSLICRSGDAFTIEAFVPWPELKVNDQPTRTTSLRDGDQLSIGGFEFTIHLQPSLATQSEDPLYAPIPLEVAAGEQTEIDPARLTAAELIEHIESAESEVTAWESSQQAGLAALLAAVHDAAPEPAATFPIADQEQVLLSELSSLSAELQQRLTDLRTREDAQRARAESLLTAQDRLAEQLKLAAQSLARQQDRTRASA